jgi:Cu(I)/Ag(I) efflux system membrane fusion protein
MRRLFAVASFLLAIIALVSVIAFAPYAAPFRERLFKPRPLSSPTAAPGPGAGPASPASRGDVVIDAVRQQLTGVRLEPVRREPLRSEVRAVGVVRYDETRQAEVNTRLAGWIRDLYADYTGRPVKTGEPLFTLYSPELLTTEKEYLLAYRGHGQGADSQVADVQRYSARLLDAARQRLLLWDVSDEHIRELEQRGQATGIATFRSPGSGVVLEKAAVKGMRVMAGQMLFRISDVSTVWVEADVYERDLASVRVSQQAQVTFDAFPGEAFGGRVSYIYPSLNEGTRTARVRFALANRSGRLRPGMFASVVMAGQAGDALTVPTNAVLDSGTEQVVFVAQGDGRFVPRPIKAGRRTAERVEVLDGVKEGEQVAAAAAFFLDSESQLRAGLQNYERSAPSREAAPPAASLDIAFKAMPDPPRMGDNVFEVTLRNASGTPVTDAEVAVRLFMPAMPTMNMPAMQNETSLPHLGGGIYRGRGLVAMGGRWDVTVTVSRKGQPIGQRQFAVVAR